MVGPDPEAQKRTEELLKIHLEAAVPLRIWELQDKSWEELQPLAKKASQVIAERGDYIMFRGKKGRSAEAVNELVTALAIGSFVPGGVKFLGLHFESKPKT